MCRTISCRTQSKRFESDLTLWDLVYGSGQSPNIRCFRAPRVLTRTPRIQSETYSWRRIGKGNWKSLSKEDRDKVIAEPKKKNTNGGVKNDNKRKLAEIQALTDDIAMMKCTVSQLAATKRNQDEQDDNAPRNDAGNHFGGRKAKAGK